MSKNQGPTLGNGKICYLEIPATDIQLSAAFYSAVFGWNIRKRGDGRLAFDDGVNEVSGTWTTDRLASSAAPGALIYIMVDDIHQAVEAIISHGGKLVQPVTGKSPELTAWFSDPAGNIFGLGQQ